MDKSSTINFTKTTVKPLLRITPSEIFEFRKEFSENNITYSSKSLLRYPGGKTRAVEIISKLIPKNVKSICSPFFGGGSVEISLASKGIKVYGYDIFQPLVEFWQFVLDSPHCLANEVEKYLPLKKEEFYSLQEEQSKLKFKLQRAATFYVLNRSSYSGATLSGGMSPDHPRFTPSSIHRLHNFYNPNFTVELADFKISIKKHSNLFLYLDPPYLIESSLYGNNGDAHKGFDHVGLSNLLKKRNKWLLSYNNCEEIQDLYIGHKKIYPNWKYGISNNKSSKEILIFSKD